MSPGLRLFVPGLLLAAFACSHSGGGEVEPSNDPVTVQVNNEFALPMEVYAIGSGINHRLGTVHPGMAGRFVVPRNLVGSGSVRLEARPSGDGRPYRSEDLLLAPGTIVDFVIAAQLFNSTVTLRP